MESIAGELAATASEKLIGVRTDPKQVRDVVQDISERLKAA